MSFPTIALLFLGALQAPAATTPQIPFPVPSKLDAWLDSPGGKITFTLEVNAPRGKKGGTPTFRLVNGARGEDVVQIERWEKTPESLVLHIDSYDSHLEFVDTPVGGERVGTWKKLRGPNQWLELSLHATVRPDKPVETPPLAPPPPSIAGRWSVKFSGSAEPAVGVFMHPTADRFSGTFLTTLGDDRCLGGSYDPKAACWQFSCFDGAHAFLFKAKVQADGSLSGDFWSGKDSHETWTAKRDDAAALPDPFGLTKSNAGVDLAKLVFTDVDGGKVSLADPKFAGKGRILQVFGTWCPNCNDEAEFLRGLDSRWRQSGLVIVGLAFELSGNPERDLAQLKAFSARHETTYPLLLAGVADKAQASKAFPLLDAIRAYPTTIFMRADGSVLAVHQGYSGPATGEAHMKLRTDFERLINELLTGKKSK